jgi:hypothetical protein
MTVSNILSQIFNSFHPEVIPQFLSGYTFIFELMAFAMLVHYLPEGWRYKVQEWLSNTPLIGQALILAVVIWIVIQVKSADLQPYLYFKF